MTNVVKKQEDAEKKISYSQELLRKTIHLGSLSLPFIYFFIEKNIILLFLFPLAISSVVIDIFSKKNKTLNNIVNKVFGKMLRSHEKQSDEIVLNGASWVFISAYLTVLVFPKIIAITGFAILIVSDIMAALIGRRFGKHPLLNKSWEGTLAFIFSAFIVVAIVGISTEMPWTFYVAAGLGAIGAGITEVASNILKADDNLTIPVAFGVVAWSLALIAEACGITFLGLL